MRVIVVTNAPVVQLTISLDLQPRYYTVVLKMFGNDFVNVFAIRVCVPDRVRVDHEHRALSTTVHTRDLVGKNFSPAREIEPFDSILRVVAHCARAVVVAARLAALALIAAKEHMAPVVAHYLSLLWACLPTWTARTSAQSSVSFRVSRHVVVQSTWC